MGTLFFNLYHHQIIIKLAWLFIVYVIVECQQIGSAIDSWIKLPFTILPAAMELTDALVGCVSIVEFEMVQTSAISR